MIMRIKKLKSTKDWRQRNDWSEYKDSIEEKFDSLPKANDFWTYSMYTWKWKTKTKALNNENSLAE